MYFFATDQNRFNKKMTKQLLLLAVLIFVLKNEIADGVCCTAPCSHLVYINQYKRAAKCNDCTRTTPHCGYGKCNFFGCKCKGGCRTGVGCSNCRTRRDVETDHKVSNATRAAQVEQHAQDSEKHLDKIFAEFDKNKNGVLEFSEAREWGFKHHDISKRDVHKIMAEFLRIDSDNDGKLARHEID